MPLSIMDVKSFCLTLLALLLLASEVHTAQDIGYLWVISQPEYALVYLDAQHIDTTPMSKWIDVEPGQYTIALAKGEHKLYEDEIIVEPGKGLRISVSLAKLDSGEPSKLTSKRYIEAYITVRSNPSGADVYLDDKLIGRTHIIDHEIQPGEPVDRKLRIVKPGYKPHEGTVKWTDIRDRIKIHFSFELEPLKQVVDAASPIKSRSPRRFVINTQAIVLFIFLLLVIAILAIRMIIRFRRRVEDD